MPHERKRHLYQFLKDQLQYWPAVALLGLRQVGKSTLIRNQLGFREYLSFDDGDVREDAENSPKAFLAKHSKPLVLDEVQKVPEIFDAIKAAIDKKRMPGQFILSGSSKFSSQSSIQESLTGRVAVCNLFPFTLAEAYAAPLDSDRLQPFHTQRPRFSIEQFSGQLRSGGLPVPLFTRSEFQQEHYWSQWISTSLGRDLKRVFGRGYDDAIAEKVLSNLVRLSGQGIAPTVADFDLDSRRVSRYLKAFESIFLLKRLACHHLGVGRDVYSFTDSGVLYALSGQKRAPELNLSLVRIQFLNEIFASTHYAGMIGRFTYFKSRKSEPIDLVWDEVPIKVIQTLDRTGWEERAVAGAMKKLGSKRGLLVGPTDQVTLPPKSGGIGLVPWTFWS